MDIFSNRAKVEISQLFLWGGWVWASLHILMDDAVQIYVQQRAEPINIENDFNKPTWKDTNVDMSISFISVHQIHFMTFERKYIYSTLNIYTYITL